MELGHSTSVCSGGGGGRAREMSSIPYVTETNFDQFINVRLTLKHY